jgi:GTP-binding protein
MRPRRAEFVTSASEPRGFPRPELPEVAVAGRSNVGKSSLINALAGAPGLARTSNTPGRTRLLNWFRIEPQKGPAFVLVDLPGFGYARVSKTMRASWRPLVEAYVQGREVLRAVILLVDARRGAEEEEQDLVAWLADLGVPVQVVLTKADKLPKSKRKPASGGVRRELGLPRDPIVSSAETGEGLPELWRFLTKATAAPPA